MVNEGKDTQKDMRKEALELAVSYFDGNNGLRIKEFIKEKFSKQYNEYYTKIAEVNKK